MKRKRQIRILMLLCLLASFSFKMSAYDPFGWDYDFGPEYRAVHARIKPYPSGKGLVYVSDEIEDNHKWYNEYKTFKGVCKDGVYLYAKPNAGYNFAGFIKANDDGTIPDSFSFDGSESPFNYRFAGKEYSDSITAAKNVPSSVQEICYAVFAKVTVRTEKEYIGKTEIYGYANDIGDFVKIKADKHVYGYEDFYAYIAGSGDNYVFDKWTVNGQTVSTDTTLTFKVTQQAEYVAHYKKIDNSSSSSSPGSSTSSSTQTQSPPATSSSSSSSSSSTSSSTSSYGSPSSPSYSTSSSSSDYSNSYDYSYEWHKRFWGFSVGYVQKQWVASNNEGREKMGFWEDSKLIHGVQAGFRFEPYAKFGLGLNTGIFYEFYYSKSKTMNVDGYDVYGELMEHALYMPLHLCYRLRFKEFQIFAFGGAGADFGLANSMKLRYEGTKDVGYESSNTYETEDSPDWKRFNASYEFGGGLRFKAVQATFTMSKGFLDSASSGSYKMRQNKPMMVTLGFMF